MAVPAALTEDQIYHRCPPEKLDFDTTESLEDLELPFGQDRVLRALEFGASMAASGFNLFVLGPSGAGKHELVKRFLATHAAGKPVPSDWCHVFNFQQSDKPGAIELPPGEGRKFKSDMNDLANELKTAIPATFESEEYQARIQELQEEVTRRQQKGLFAIQEEANANNIAMITTPAGFTFAPMRNGEVIEPEEYKKFSDEEKELVEAKVEDLRISCSRRFSRFPGCARKCGNGYISSMKRWCSSRLAAPLANCVRNGAMFRRWSPTWIRCGKTWWSTLRPSRITRTVRLPGC